jgi:hypothetical protein
MSLGGPAECDHLGCGAQRREVNRWYVVTFDIFGAHIWKWETCSDEDMKIGKHFCGLAHAFQYASKVLTPDETKVGRESTLELKPPLTREGTTPEEVITQEPPEAEETEKPNGN